MAGPKATVSNLFFNETEKASGRGFYGLADGPYFLMQNAYQAVPED